MRPLEDPEDRVAVVSLAVATIMLLLALASCGRATTTNPLTPRAEPQNSLSYSGTPRGWSLVVFALPE